MKISPLLPNFNLSRVILFPLILYLVVFNISITLSTSRFEFEVTYPFSSFLPSALCETESDGKKMIAVQI